METIVIVALVVLLFVAVLITIIARWVRRGLDEAQAAAKESLRDFRTMIETAKEGVWRLNREGKTVFVNQKMAEMLGYTVEEVINKQVTDFMFPEDREAHEWQMKDRLKGKSADYERRFCRKDGSEIYTLVSASPLKNDQQQFDGAFALITDITELKREAKNQSLLNKILEISNQALGLADTIANIITAIKQHTGFDAVGIRLRSSEDFPYFSQNGFPDAFLQKENSLVAHDKDGGICLDEKGKCKLECTCGLVLAGQIDPSNTAFTAYGSFWTNNSCLLQCLPADPDPRLQSRNACIQNGYESIALVPIKNDAIIGLLQLNDRQKDRFTLAQVQFFERICALIGAVLIRIKTVEDLKASEERHRILFEKSQDALMTLAPPTWRFTSGNPAAIKLFGARNAADFVSRGPWEYSPKDQPDGQASATKAREMIETAMRDGAHFFEWTHKRIDGSDFPATVLLTRMEIDGVPLLQATARDETEKKKLEASLAQRDRLADMGLLAASVAHEINNPLTYVLLYIESLLQDLVSFDRSKPPEPALLQDAVDRAQKVFDGTQQIKAIVRHLGAFSKSDRGELAKVDLKLTIESVLSMAASEIRYRARLVNDMVPVPAVLASEGKLAQVFLNIFLNAAHAVGEGDVKNNQITIRTWAEGEYVFAEVSDTGRGIPPENLERIFEPFFTTKKGVGTGLGLSICKSIITEFGGDISVKSQVGKGACFLIRLPMMRVEATVKDNLPIVELPDVESERGRILVVDDDVDIGNSIKRLFRHQHEVITVVSGSQAKALLEQDRSFDLILCDLMMSEMTGMAFHGWLATFDPALAKQLVFITGGAFTPNASSYLASIDNLQIQKPFDVPQFVRLVNAKIFAARVR